MTAWSWTALAEPKGQPRARATAWGGKPRMWTPSSADAFKNAVAVGAREAVPAELQPLDQPWALTVVFYLPRPKRLGKRDDTPPHTAKSDLDNLCKAALDAIVGAGVARDDAPMWELHARKVYCEYGDAPRAEFRLSIGENDA